MSRRPLFLMTKRASPGKDWESNPYTTDQKLHILYGLTLENIKPRDTKT